MLNLNLISFLLSTSTSSTSSSSLISSDSSDSLSSSSVLSNELNLLVIGDWGGSASFPYYTLPQKYTSEGMSNIANIINPQAVISLGDNFYYVGVTNENVEERYKATFEDVSLFLYFSISFFNSNSSLIHILGLFTTFISFNSLV